MTNETMPCGAIDICVPAVLRPSRNFPKRPPVSTKCVIYPSSRQWKLALGKFGRESIALSAGILALLFFGLPAATDAQQPSTDQGQSNKKTVPDAPAPPAGARPSGDAQSGVLKPPDFDPKMAKSVPDVDPAMDNRPPGKAPASPEPAAPKVLPR